MTKRKIHLTTIPPPKNPWELTESGETAKKKKKKNAHPPYSYCT